MSVDFHMPDSWYNPPPDHDCPNAPEPCQCVDRNEDARESALIAQQDAKDGR